MTSTTLSLVLHHLRPDPRPRLRKPLMVGSPADVRASEVVRDAYLGKTAVA